MKTKKTSEFHFPEQGAPAEQVLNSLARCCAQLYLKRTVTAEEIHGDADLSLHAFFPDVVLAYLGYGLQDVDAANFLRVTRGKQ